MSWFAVDDRFPDHRKAMRLRRSGHFADALAVWLIAGCWAARDPEANVDGRVPIDVLAASGIPGWQDALDALVAVELWTCDGENVVFHDWSEWNGPNAKHNRSTEQTRLRTIRYRLQKCRDGRHDRHCPRVDADGEPWSCPKREKQAPSAGARGSRAGDVTPGTGTGTGTGSSRDGTNDETNVIQWDDVAPQLRTPKSLGGAS